MEPPLFFDLDAALEKEGRNFKEAYLWLSEAMPRLFFQEIGREDLMLIAHNLVGFSTHDFWATVHLKHEAIVMCIDSSEADLKILSRYADHGIRNYRTYVSSKPLSFLHLKEKLRIAAIRFTGACTPAERPLEEELATRLQREVRGINREIGDAAFYNLLEGLDERFLQALSFEQLVLAVNLYFQAQFDDRCQYEIEYKKRGSEEASMQLILAWRNAPKQLFLYRLARTIHRHGLVMKGVNAAYCESLSGDTVLIMALGIHGSGGEDVWEVANIPNFIREFITVKYFSGFDKIDRCLVGPGLIEGNLGKLVGAMSRFVHQALVHLNPSLYTLDSIADDLAVFQELTCKLVDAFTYKFDPDYLDPERFETLCEELAKDIRHIDTGHERNDLRRRHVFRAALDFLVHTLKTNFYEYNYTALSFRLDPAYLWELPEGRELYPLLPYAIFFVKGMDFFGFHIRFSDLARGGLRTLFLKNSERLQLECDRVFSECYNLAFTQHKKNREIPEGGAKGVIFLHPYESLEREGKILQRELREADAPADAVEKELERFYREEKVKLLHQAQRSFVSSLLSIVNYGQEGRIRSKHVVDYYKKPENLYLGPDENMQPEMIEWIAAYSVKEGYPLGSAFISSKPKIGINHKEYGVTSSGIHVYLQEVLRHLGIDPKRQRFTVKMTGGPDGDVAGNQIVNLFRDYPDTAKLVALTDGSGTIFDPEGLRLEALVGLFKKAQPINFYPPEELSLGGFLVDQYNKRSKTTFEKLTLCWRHEEEGLCRRWLSSSEMNRLVRHHLHRTKADLFIPAGGRPRTLNEENWRDFLDEQGAPSSRAIIEGANLYCDGAARRHLEELGVLIIKDSSANKAGVICSSYEVLAGLVLGDELLLRYRERLVEEILERVKICAYKEASLLLEAGRRTDLPLTELSDKASKKMHEFRGQLLRFLDAQQLPEDPNHFFNKVLIRYFPRTIQAEFQERIFSNLSEQHLKAVIACSLASEFVYQRGLDWAPSIIDTLPLAGKSRLLPR